MKNECGSERNQLFNAVYFSQNFIPHLIFFLICLIKNNSSFAILYGENAMAYLSQDNKDTKI